MFLMVGFACCILITSHAQRIVYSEPNREDVRQTNFEIIGRYNSNVLIYKNLRSKNVISTYDIDMKETDRLSLDYLPG